MASGLPGLRDIREPGTKRQRREGRAGPVPLLLLEETWQLGTHW